MKQKNSRPRNRKAQLTQQVYNRLHEEKAKKIREEAPLFGGRGRCVNEARPYVDRSAAPEQEGAIKRADVSHSASDDPESRSEI